MTKARDLSSLANGVPNSLINLDSAEIPNLDTAKITTGTLSADRIDNNSLSNVTALPSGVGGIALQSVQTTSFTAVAGRGYPCDTTLAGFTVTLPATPSAGQQVQLVDYAGTFNTNQLIINPNGEDLEGGADNLVLRGEREGVILTYIDSTQGWIATSGINEGTDALEPNTYSADFLVVAGGGAGGFSSSVGGGGGAGGYRSSNATYGNSGGGASAESSLTFISGAVYTITVGAGGSGNQGNAGGANGSNSLISGTGITTITSTGGGGGGGDAGTVNGFSGGSGGGGSGSSISSTSGTANQGYAGGFTDTGGYASSGGGGAGQAGVNASGSGVSAIAGNGGNGVASTITGSSVTRGGGGGGGDWSGGNFGTGGTGGGGRGCGSQASNDSTNGTVNTGGGAGGQSADTGTQKSGGKGVVILRMPDANYSATTTGSPTVNQNVGGSGETVIIFNDSGSYTG
jgi:mucin-19